MTSQLPASCLGATGGGLVAAIGIRCRGASGACASRYRFTCALSAPSMSHRSARRTEPGDPAENHAVLLRRSFGLAPHQLSTTESVMMTATTPMNMKATSPADAHGQ